MIEMKDKFILDACCGGRMMWTNKKHPNTIYIDFRKENYEVKKGHMKNISINPDYLMDFRKLDFPDKTFKLIVFDPPHLSKIGETSLFKKMFGKLNAETWPIDLKQGFNELWRVLEDYGILVFKWNSFEISFKKVLSLFPVKPLFSNVTSSRPNKSDTKWFCFMKIPIKSQGKR